MTPPTDGRLGTGAHPIDGDVAAVLEWLRVRHGDDVRLAEPPTVKDEGLDSTIHFVRFTGRSLPEDWRAPLVLRVKADVTREAEAHREAAIHGWLADHCYPAPRVLAVLDTGDALGRPAQVMQRAPGTLLLDALRGAPWQARRRMHELAATQTWLHSMPTLGFPPGPDLLDRRLEVPRRVASVIDDDRLDAALQTVEAMAPRLREAPLAVCHGDFHPLNVLVSDAGPAVIDWTDAGLGDRHGDVARTRVLFEVAAIAATVRVERAVLRVAGPRLGRLYQRAYSGRLELDGDRLALWTPVHLLHAWSQAAALHGGLLTPDGHPDERTRRVPPAMVDELARRFQEVLVRVPS